MKPCKLIVTSMVNFQISYIYQFHRFRPSQLRLTMPHTQGQIIPISFIFHWYGRQTASTQRTAIYGTDSQEDASPVTTILISSSLMSTMISPTYPHMYFLLSLSQQLHTLTLYLEWLLDFLLGVYGSFKLLVRIAEFFFVVIIFFTR